MINSVASIYHLSFQYECSFFLLSVSVRGLVRFLDLDCDYDVSHRSLVELHSVLNQVVKNKLVRFLICNDCKVFISELD